MIGCQCDVCLSTDPRDKRNRPSILLTTEHQQYLIDTPPELRLSCIRFGVNHIDAILFTHHHADHIMGLDDVRRFNHLKDGSMTCYGTEETLREIQNTFRYAFGSNHFGGGLPVIELQPVADTFSVNGDIFQMLPVMHGPTTQVNGFRLGSFAYLTDVKTVPGQTKEQLRGLDTLILGVLRHRPHPTHLSVSEALELLDDLQPRQAFFTHISHDLGHEQTEAELPQGVRLAFDGLTLELDA